MPLPLNINPEDVYDDVSVRARAYADLSVKLAEQGDAYGASLTMMASDVCNLQALLWQSALVISTDQDGQYAAVLRAMDTALTLWAAQGAHGDIGCASVLHGARKAIHDAFDASVWEMLEPRLASLDHLSGLEVPEAPLMRQRRDDFLGGREPLAAARETAAAGRDSASVAIAMNTSGRTEDAVTAAYHSDLDAFQAHLMAQSIAFDDREMAAAEALWLLACDTTAKITALPADLERSTGVVRMTLGAITGVLDAQNLNHQFARMDAVPQLVPDDTAEHEPSGYGA